MAVTGLEVRSREPYEGGRTFDDGGAYERIDGVIRFALDPADAHNEAIVDLNLAPRDGQGLVAFVADFCLLQPLDPRRSARRLLFEVVNRGNRLAPRMLNRAATAPAPSERIQPGDGFLLRHGWTLAWCGWQWDVPQSPVVLGLKAPRAQRDGQPVEGRISVQFQPNRHIAEALLADRVHTPYPAAYLDDPEAELSVRERSDARRTLIPRARWQFAREVDGRRVPDATRVWLEGGFEAGRLYEVVYRTRECPVVGSGLLAVRDAASYLRYGGVEQGNPGAGAIDHAYGFGASQSGRFLRHFLSLGLNLDEQRRQVFDGLLIHIAGARRGEFNHRFAQPSVAGSPSFGYLPPFMGGEGDERTDPRSGGNDGVFSRQRRLGGMPRVFSTNTAAEYWRGDASLMHTETDGAVVTRDVEPSADERIYLFAGTQHGPGELPLTKLNPLDGSRGLHAFNFVDYTPLLRAALLNLDAWASDGIEPPPSRFPRLADGTAAPRDEVLAAFRGIPGADVPDAALLPVISSIDLGPEAVRGVGRFPVELGRSYPVVVSAVDDDGNEIAGVRLPDIAAPVATNTGWNPRDPQTGGAGEIIGMRGSTLPFAATAEERRRGGDRRPAISERYRDREAYLTRVRAVAAELVAARYLLGEDEELAVALAATRYDAFAATAEAVAGD
ncbi:MAG: alpha/beta hydrolase domain-containing protein [Dehalococcoidia bacterium]